MTLSSRRRGSRWGLLAFSVVLLAFVYTTIANVIERPDGIQIASFFIVSIIVVARLSGAALARASSGAYRDG